MRNKRQRRDFTDEFKNDAVKLVIEQGYNCSKVARRLGICQSKNEILDYITYYNSIRLHSTLEYLSPMEYEKELYLEVA